ncbi:MAG: histidine kinase, partial [Gammaproteobacteria bacterium]|nr:histidine kinase [Gammaproteobacteria bacterium]
CPRSDDDAEFLEGAASVLARMIAHGRDAQRTRQLLEVNRQLNRQIITKQEEEYRRIARELHDDIGQSIAAIKTEVALLAQTTDSGEASRGAKAIGAEADRIYETMHETVRRLRPGVLDDLGLVAAIRVYITDWQARRPVMSCRFNAEGQFDDIDEAVKVTAYRLVQESLTNVVRHATATEVRVSLSRQTAESQGLRGWVVIEVADNGRGMEAAKLHAQKGRFGLLGMRERVEGLAGVFTIVTAAGKGFHLHARLPLVERRTRPRG